jgi:signal peptidase
MTSPKVFPDITAELLEEGHSIRFQAPGRSMHPTIRDGETIIVEPVTPSSVKVGDIILYRSKTGVIAHRVIQIKRDKIGALPSSSSLSPNCFFILRGDASANRDFPVEREQILGKVVSVERAGRSVDLYTWRAKIGRIAHGCASRLQQWMIRVALSQ